MRSFFHGETEIEQLTKTIKELIMSTTALTAAITQLSTDIATLVQLAENSVPQAQVDAVTATVIALDQTVQTAMNTINPPAAPAAPATPPATA